MKIIQGPFKDYYDHVAFVHGGGDPKVTYHRRRIGELDSKLSMVRDVEVIVKDWESLVSDMEQIGSWGGFYRMHTWLVVAGKAYPLVEIERYPFRYELLDPQKHQKMVRKEDRNGIERTAEITPVGVELPQLVALSRQIGHPVFVIKSAAFSGRDGEYKITIDGNCPILRDIGLPSIYPAEQLYQDLALFMGNTIRISPDSAPPTQMTDVQKIDSHGFDRKASFRHRK